MHFCPKFYAHLGKCLSHIYKSPCKISLKNFNIFPSPFWVEIHEIGPSNYLSWAVIIYAEFRCLGGFLVILPPHMMLFGSSWDFGSTIGGFSGILAPILISRKVNNVQKLGFWSISGAPLGNLIIYRVFW